MSTHAGCKRQRRCSPPHKRKCPPQLRLLAPKGNALPSHPETTVQYRLQNNIQDQQYTEGPYQANDVNLAISQSSAPVYSGHGFTSSPLLWPDRTFSSLQRNQDSAVAPYPNTYSNWIPLTTVGGDFPEPSPRDLFRGVVTLESHGLSTHYLPDGNLQFQETTIQNQHGEHYLMPMLNSGDAQPTIGVQYQDQPSQYIINQHPPIFTQPLPAAQPAPLSQNSQHLPCANCPSIWCFHLESITFSDLGDKRISNIKRSYQDLRQHIHEAHQWHYESGCALCEHLFCYHLGKIMLLEATKGDLTDVNIDLGNSFMTLRQHIQEAHGGC